MSLFNTPHRHIAIVEILAKQNNGISRNDICNVGKMSPNGHLTTALIELVQCDFIEKYSDFTKNKNDSYYYLKDPFTLFFLRYMKDNNTKDEYFWTNYADDGGHRAWSGYAFEQVCRIHIRQIKAKLGISGVSTSTTSWRSKQSNPGAQIDLVICRKDGVINLCEIKYAKHPYQITKTDAAMLEQKKSIFTMESKTKHAIHITFISTYGTAKKGFFGIVQSEVTMDDLFL